MRGLCRAVDVTGTAEGTLAVFPMPRALCGAQSTAPGAAEGGGRVKMKAGWAFPEADEFMRAQLKDDGTYQDRQLTTAMRYVKDFSVAIDGGAHVGTWSQRLSPRFQRVIAVEPCADTFDALLMNMAHFHCENVDCRPVALGAKKGYVSIAPLEPRAEALHNTGARFVQAGGTIPCEAIDEWALPSLGFLKLDVEGSEALAMEGARQTLKRCRPVVLFEDKGFCRRFGQKADAPHRFLESINYHCVEVVSKDQIWTARRA